MSAAAGPRRGSRAAVAALAATGALLAGAVPAEGALSLTAPASKSFGTVTLNGVNQTTTYTLALTAGDTGPSAGWRISATSTLLSTPGPPAASLPAAASTVTGVTATCVSSCGPTPVNSVTYPFTLPAATVAPAAVPLRNAASGTGTGTWTITPTVSIAVPANAYKGSYSSVVTVTIASGP